MNPIDTMEQTKMTTKNTDRKTAETRKPSAVPVVESAQETVTETAMETPAQPEPMRKNSILKIETSTEVVTMTWADGIVDKLEIAKLSKAIIEAAIENGLKQKLGDAAAISRDPITGRSATIQTKRERVRAVAQNLLDGHWIAPTRSGSGGGDSIRRTLVNALLQLNPALDRERVTAAITAKSHAEVLAMRAVPRVAAVIAQLAGAGNVDADGMLDELGI